MHNRQPGAGLRGEAKKAGEQGLEPQIRRPERRVLPITPLPSGATRSRGYDRAVSIERLSRANPWLAATLPVGAAGLVALGRADDASVLVVLWLMLLAVSRVELPAAWRAVITITVVVEAWAPVLGAYTALPGSDKLIHGWATALVALVGARLLAAAGVLSREP